MDQYFGIPIEFSIQNLINYNNSEQRQQLLSTVSRFSKNCTVVSTEYFNFIFQLSQIYSNIQVINTQQQKQTILRIICNILELCDDSRMITQIFNQELVLDMQNNMHSLACSIIKLKISKNDDILNISNYDSFLFVNSSLLIMRKLEYPAIFDQNIMELAVSVANLCYQYYAYQNPLKQLLLASCFLSRLCHCVEGLCYRQYINPRFFRGLCIFRDMNSPKIQPLSLKYILKTAIVQCEMNDGYQQQLFQILDKNKEHTFIFDNQQAFKREIIAKLEIEQ